MIELRDMQLLIALAQHRHFAKAAHACNISQPAFSMRIRNLEDRFGVAIVRRGNRFLGFTEQGEIVVRRARVILEEARALEQEVSAADGQVSGTLTLGVVPTALAHAARLCIRLHGSYPGIVVRIESTTSLLIQQRIDEGSVDAGITYEDSVSRDLMRVEWLYDEGYVLLVPVAMAPRKTGTVTWAEAAALPLSLLDPHMQNRRILDRMFIEIGAQPQVVAETNGFTTSLVMAREGLAATILPRVLVEALGDLAGTVVLPLTGPELTKSICLVTPSRAPGLATVEALRRVLEMDGR